jgi:protease I
MPDLTGLRVAIVATHGVERVELTEPRKVLLESGAQVDVLSPDGGQIQSMNHDEKAEMIKCQGTIAAADPAEYDGLLVPGGVVNSDSLRMVEEARLFATRFDQWGKPMAVICHGPWLLVSSDLVLGRTLTSYYTLQDDIRNAGGNWVDQEACVDRSWVTSRNPQDLPAFNREFANMLAAVPHGRQA